MVYLNLCPVLLLQLTFMVATSQGAQCFNCTGVNGTHCGDPFNGTLVDKETCNTKEETAGFTDAVVYICYKTKEKIEGGWLYNRGCTWSGQYGLYTDNCVFVGNATFDEFCMCKGDWCNPAERARASALIVASYLLLAYLLLG
nr:uncharacterized protein LOC123756599 [Procambarus clarkii]